MLLLGILSLPFAGGLLSFASLGVKQRWLLLLVACGHAAMVFGTLFHRPGPILGGWIEGDAIGLLFLAITSVMFLVVSVYAVGYLQREVSSPRTDWVEGALFSNAPERTFVGCLLFFLGAMSLVTLSRHLGLLWVAVEGTTLASAPLIYFHRHHRSLEATWKYLLICSVGIALALLGTFFLSIAVTNQDLEATPLFIRDLIAAAPGANPSWLKAAFILFLVGYGTKMGMAPFHTWLPDAHSEAPSLVSALLSGALLNCAFLGVLRVFQVTAAAGQGAFAQDLLVLFGLLSMVVGAVFVMGQTDYKRMLAYSSVEHMGILALGVGIGGAAAFGAMLHAMNHSLAKGLLFLVAGNILALYKTTRARGVRGVLRVLPLSGPLWVAGFLAISGSPPFGTFLSEFTILQEGITQGKWYIMGMYLGALAIVFIGMATVVLNMAQGDPSTIALDETARQPRFGKEAVLAFAPPALLAAAVLLLGLYLPPGLERMLREASALLGGP